MDPTPAAGIRVGRQRQAAAEELVAQTVDTGLLGDRLWLLQVNRPLEVQSQVGTPPEVLLMVLQVGTPPEVQSQVLQVGTPPVHSHQVAVDADPGLLDLVGT